MSSQNKVVGMPLAGRKSPRLPTRRSSIDNADIVIVGNGIAGLTAAVEARRLDPEKRIVIITEQSHPTINTPALKQFVIGRLTREQLLAYPAGTERAQQIHVINARVEEIKTLGKFVYLDGGQAFGYDSLLLATGSKPRGLPASLPGRDFDGVLTLHRMNDYLDLRRRLNEVDEAVVIGGGTHAIETVRCLLHSGIAVHWLIRSNTFLPRMLDRPASDMVLERISRAGVKVYTETEAVGIVGRVGAVVGVVTNTHKMLPCQLVLVCTGTTPQTTLANRCDVPLEHRYGILVDDHLRTNLDNIYAAGDAAALKNPQTGAYEPRAQWYAAVLQGRVAAAMMTGCHDAAVPFGVPWHATQVGGLSLLSVGNPLSWIEGAATLTDSSKGSYRRISICDDRLVGYLSLGPTQPDGLAIKRLIDEGHPVREVKKALLKGEFDASQYFSAQRSHAAHRMVTTGKLEASPFQLRAWTTAHSTEHSPRHTDALSPVSALNRKYDVEGNPFMAPFSSQAGFYGYEEEISPFTGNLPLASTDPLAVRSKEIVESTLVALPARTSRLDSRGLWSYSDKVPAVSVKARTGAQFRAPRIQGDLLPATEELTREATKC